MCLDGFSFPIFFPKLKLYDEQRRNKNNIQKSENPLFMGKTRKDKQRQTNLNSNPDDEDFGWKRPVIPRALKKSDSLKKN